MEAGEEVAAVWEQLELEPGATVEVERREEEGRGLEEGGFEGELRLGGRGGKWRGSGGQEEAEGGGDCRPGKRGSEGKQSP